MTPVAPARLAAVAGSLVQTRSRGSERLVSAAYFAITSPVVIFAVAIVLAAIRRPTLISRAEFLYEDGTIFYMGAFEHGLGSIFMPYAGYLHVAARLLALPELLVPIAVAPLVGSIMSLLVVGFTAAYLQRLPMPAAGRMALAAVVVLMPSVKDVLGFLFDVQWYLAIVLVAAPFVRPRAWDYALIAVISLTGPFSILLLPLYLVVARDRRAVVIGICAAIQVVVFLTSGRNPATGDASLLTILEVVGFRALAIPVSGRVTFPIPPELAALLGYLVMLPLAIIAARRHRIALAFGYAAVVIAFAGALFGPTRGEFMLHGLSGERYFIMAPVALAAAAIVGLLSGQRWRMVAGGALALLLGIGIVRDFRVQPWPSQGWVQHAPGCIGGPDPCIVPVYPPQIASIRWPGR